MLHDGHVKFQVPKDRKSALLKPMSEFYFTLSIKAFLKNTCGMNNLFFVPCKHILYMCMLALMSMLLACPDFMFAKTAFR